MDRPVALFFDRFEHCSTPAVNELLLRLSDGADRGLEIVVASRTAPAFASERLRLEGRVREIRASSLSLTAEEVLRLWPDSADSSFTKVAAGEADGWPLAVQLAHSIEVRAGSDTPSEVLRAEWLTMLSAYIEQEILSSLPAQLRQTLLDVSILDGVDGQLASHMREDDQSAIQVLELEQRYGILVMDPARGCFRMERVIARCMAQILLRESPVRAQVLHTRAAEWYERNRDYVHAIAHATASGNDDLIGPIVDRAGGIQLGFRLGIASLRKILALMPSQLHLTNPRISILKALQLIKDGAIEEARSLRRIVADTAGRDPTVAERIAVDQALLDLFFVVDGGPLDPEFPGRLTRKWRQPDAMTAAQMATLAAAVESYAFQQSGDLKRATLATRTWRRFDDMLQWEYNELFVELQLGKIALARGELDEATAAFEQVVERSEGRQYGNEHSLVQAARILLANVLYLRGEDAGARELLPARAADLERWFCWYDPRAICYALILRFASDDGGSAEIGRAYSEIMEQVSSRGLQGLDVLAAAEAAVAQMRFQPGIVPSPLFASMERGLARLRAAPHAARAWRIDDAVRLASGLRHLVTGRAARAVLVARKWMQRAHQEERRPSYLTALMLNVLAHDALDREAESRRLMREALLLAAETGVIEPFLSLAPFGTGYMLERLTITPGVPYESLAALLRRRLGGVSACIAGVVKVQEVLSPREMAVLKGMHCGRSNKHIARDLKISENTVKFHARNLFRKLGVSRRRDVVSAARRYMSARRTTPPLPE
jgi:LuxR family maltose regulon positive regulatory protein